MSRSLKAHVLLVLVTMLWGTTFVLNKAALSWTSPFLFNAVRLTVAAVVLGVLYWRHILRITRPVLISGSLVGLWLFAGFEFQIAGLRFTTPSKSAFLTGGSTVIVPVLLVLLWRARISRWRLAGVACAVMGLFLMTVPGGPQGIGDFARVNRGDVLSVGCAIGFALQIILLGRATGRFPFQAIAFLQVAVGAALMWAALPMLEKPHAVLGSTLIWAIVITGVFGIALAFTVQAWAQQFTPATHTALIFTLEPVFAWITSFIYLHERLGVRAGIGALMIVAGVLISELLGGSGKQNGEVAANSAG